MYKFLCQKRPLNFNTLKSFKNNTMTTYRNFFQNKTIERSVIFFLCVVCLLIVSMPDSFAIQTDALKDPMKTLKKEAFDWAFALKISAGLIGTVTSIMKQSLTPFGIGLGSMAGLSFFDSYIGTGDAALIGELFI